MQFFYVGNNGSKLILVNDQLTFFTKRRVSHLFYTCVLIVLIGTGALSAYGGMANETYTKRIVFSPGHSKTTVPVCGVQMQDSVEGYTKSSTNNQIFYLLTIKNTGTSRDSFSLSYSSTSTPLYTYLETVGGTPMTKTTGIEPGGSYSFIIRFVVPNGSPAQTTNYTNLVATSSICGSSSTDTTHLLTHLYSGKPVTGDSCDVGITKTADVGTVTAGNNITYTISLLNNLPGEATDVFVIDTLSSSVVYQSSYVSVIPSDGNYSLTYNSTTHVVQFKYLKTLGQNQPITLVIIVKPGCTAVPSVSNKVLVSSSTYDNKPTNDTSSVTTVVNTAFSAPTASRVTSCYNSAATLWASGAGSRTGYQWYSASTGGSLLFTGQNYTTPLLNSSSTYYVGYYNLDTTTCIGPRTAVMVTVKPAPVITGPSGMIVCANDAASFSVSTTGSNPVYQWQQSSNGGSSWANLANSSNYSGVTGTTLTISSATYSINSYQYRCNIAAEGCTNTISSSVATLTVRKSYTWLGINTNWNDTNNWCSGIPDSSSDVTIPSGLTYYPVIASDIGNSRDITIETGASLTVKNDGTLKIAGNIYNSGNFDATTGTVEMNGSNPQTISGSAFANKTIKNLVVNNTGSGLSVSSVANDTLKITGLLSFGNASTVLNTGDNITLVSNNTGTASVGIVGGSNAINGKVIVEKYINTGTASGQHAKAWQFLSTPTAGQTVKESWMENGVTTNYYGTMISSPAGTAAGFDITSVAPSIKYYNQLNNSWTGVSNTGNLIADVRGYMVFVRGDRTVTASNQPANPTVLRTKGTLYTGTLTPVIVQLDNFQSIGNPYASAIDFTLISKDAGIDNKFYVFDPYLYGSYGVGGYQIMSAVNNWQPVPGGTLLYPSGLANTIIQSGQAFFVHATSTHSSGTAALTFMENCKSFGTNSSKLLRIMTDTTDQKRQFLRASLLTNTGLMADGNVVAFDMTFSNEINGDDALKILNSGENFTVKTNGKLLAIDAKPPLSSTDTIFYYTSNLVKTTYKLIFAPENMQSANLQAFLIDKFLKTETPVSLIDTSFVNITVTSDAASSASDRFKIVFRQLASLPVTISSVTATLKNNDVEVKWNVQNENSIQQYQVEKSTDGVHFSPAATINAKNTISGNYSWLDENVPQGIYYYRITVLSVDGRTSNTQIVKVIAGEPAKKISVYPNPITDGIIHLQMNNQQQGVYSVRLFNSAGQLVYSKKINLVNAIGEETIICPNLPKGTYQLEVAKPTGNIQGIKVIN